MEWKKEKNGIFQQIAGINRYDEKMATGKKSNKTDLNFFSNFLGLSTIVLFRVCFFCHSYFAIYLYLRISLHCVCSYYIHNIISFVRKRIVYINFEQQLATTQQ